MQFESSITWKKLCLELELLNTEPPHSLAPLALSFHCLIDDYLNTEQTFRELGQLGYEFASLCQQMGESDRFEFLNQFFFRKKRFEIQSCSLDSCHSSDLLLADLLKNKRGHVLPLSLIYLHLASSADLPIYPIKYTNQGVLKWVRGGRCCYIDLTKQGKILDEQDLASLIQQSSSESEDIPEANFEVLHAKSLTLIYLKQLAAFFENHEKCLKLYKLYGIILFLEPSNLFYLKKRALLGRDLGLHKEAMGDIKRYFSFSDRKDAPHSLKVAYYELQNLHPQNEPPQGMIH